MLESRVANPIMPLRILRLRMLMGSSLVRGLLVTGMFSAFFLGALYLERVLGYDAIDTGLAFMPLTLSIAAMSMGVSARAMVGASVRCTRSRPGSRGSSPACCCWPARACTRATSRACSSPSSLLGLGAGASFLPLLTMGMADAPTRDAGLASGIINVSVQLFGAIGLATLGTIATDHTKALSASGHSLACALTGGYHLAYLVAAVCVVFGILVALLTLRPPSREPCRRRSWRSRRGCVRGSSSRRRRPELCSSARLILPLAVFGSSAAKSTIRGYLYGAVSRLTCSCSSRASSGEGGVAVAQHDHRPHDRAALLVGGGDGGGLGDGRVGDERRLDLERTDPVAGRDDHVVGSALEVKPAVLVLAHAVARAPGAARARGPRPPSARAPVGAVAADALAEVAEEEGGHARGIGRQLAVDAPRGACRAAPGPSSRAAPAAPSGGAGQLSGLGLAVAVADLKARGLAPGAQHLGVQRLAGGDHPAQVRQRSQARALGDHAVLGRRHAEHVHALALEQLEPLVRDRSARRAAAPPRRTATAR